jgi:hypothetical protein
VSGPVDAGTAPQFTAPGLERLQHAKQGRTMSMACKSALGSRF